MKVYQNQVFDEERALYGSEDVQVTACRFDGPADGESALKESRDIQVSDSYFNLRYPFWHDHNLRISHCEMTEQCRAALWYSGDIQIRDSKLHGIKALRECDSVTIENSDIISPEFGWSVRNITMRDTTVSSEYFMMRSEKLTFDRVKLNGKYSFQYITDSVFTGCEFDTKDAFWHARNVLVKDSVIKGEYLAWYCENVTFENCTIIGTQPLCYCRGLKLVNCRMIDTDLAFEKSEVNATVTTVVESIKNPKSGVITVPGVKEIIMDDPHAEGQIRIVNHADSGRKTIHVVAALIRRGDEVLATQRGYGDYKDWWEFPGGKIKPGETPEAALAREIREELAADISVGGYLTTVEYDYPEFHLSMACYWCTVREGHLTLLEHEAAKWLPLGNLRQVNWLPADILVIEEIEKEGTIPD